MSIGLELVLDRFNKIYSEDEVLVGKAVLIGKTSDAKHDGLFLTLEGLVNLQMSNKSPLALLSHHIELLPAGKLPQGTTEIPFKFPLKSQKEGRPLYETYHGVFIHINYVLKCELKRSFLAKTVNKVQEFIILSKPIDQPPHKDVKFSITPDSLRKNAKERIQIPRFHITGRLNETVACITRPFTGHLTIQHTEVPIKSIDIQLVRVETCSSAEGYTRDATEIQNIQVADGNVCPTLDIPIYMIFPRLFSCPSLSTENSFKVEFELNLVIIFKDDYLKCLRARHWVSPGGWKFLYQHGCCAIGEPKESSLNFP